MCGILGLFQHSAADALYTGLLHLQHRGQDAAGMVTFTDRFHIKHGLGLVHDVFQQDDLNHLPGEFGIGHTRYPTSGGAKLEDAQPFVHELGIALAHSGQLLNAQEIEVPKAQSSVDSVVLLHLLAEGINQVSLDQEPEAFFSVACSSVRRVFDRVQGSYSVVSLVLGRGLLAFRDPHGIRPLAIGERQDFNGKKEYIFASEPTMFAPLGYALTGNVQPGEVVYVDALGQLHRRTLLSKTFKPCIFEHVYFAHASTVLNGVSVYQARINMGERLARRWQAEFPTIRPDVVVPIPATANTSALGFAQALGVRYAEGLCVNPFVGRTFITPNGCERALRVRNKLTPLKSEIENKKVLLFDDSIVRGITAAEVVKMLRSFGAQEIYFVSACPPIKNTCQFGINIPTRAELIAAGRTSEEIRALLGVDKLLYQTPEDLSASVSIQGKACMKCMHTNL